MPVPEDSQRLVDELVRLEGEIAFLVEALNPDQLNWQPDSERAWSVGQCIDHLSRSNGIYLPALSKAANEGRSEAVLRRGALRPNWLGGLFIRSIEPPARMKLKAPLAEMQPKSRLEKAPLLAEFSARQREVIELAQRSADLDFNGIRFANPMLRGLRVFNLATGLLVIAAHERRHLWQARRVKKRPDFPNGPTS